MVDIKMNDAANLNLVANVQKAIASLQQNEGKPHMAILFPGFSAQVNRILASSPGTKVAMGNIIEEAKPVPVAPPKVNSIP